MDHGWMDGTNSQPQKDNTTRQTAAMKRRKAELEKISCQMEMDRWIDRSDERRQQQQQQVPCSVLASLRPETRRGSGSESRHNPNHKLHDTTLRAVVGILLGLLRVSKSAAEGQCMNECTVQTHRQTMKLRLHCQSERWQIQYRCLDGCHVWSKDIFTSLTRLDSGQPWSDRPGGEKSRAPDVKVEGGGESRGR